MSTALLAKADRETEVSLPTESLAVQTPTESTRTIGTQYLERDVPCIVPKLPGKLVDNSTQTDATSCLASCQTQTNQAFIEDTEQHVGTFDSPMKHQETNDPDFSLSDSASTSDSDEEVVDDYMEEKYIVFKSQLYSLLEKCPACSAPCHVSEKQRLGSFIKLERTCTNQHCEESYIWCSQKEVNVGGKRNLPLGNIMLSAAILFSGLPISKTLRMLQFLNIACISRRTFDTHNTRYLQPAVWHVWSAHQQENLEEIRSRTEPLVIGADGRCDSPGHCSKFLSYSMMDLHSKKIIDFQMIQSNEVGGSTRMEVEGLERSLDLLLNRYDLPIEAIVTDRHVQVVKLLRENYPHISHFFDVWHVAKGLVKKLEQLSKRKECVDIHPWIKSIANHLYWCASSSDGRSELVVAKWQSLINHICNKHRHENPHFPECLHGDIEERLWLEEGTAACEMLRDLLYKTRFMSDISKLSPHHQTSSVEGFHSLIINYAPKHTGYSFRGMITRTALAALHHNENCTRAPAVTRKGEKRYSILFPKYKKGDPTVVAKKPDATYGNCYLTPCKVLASSLKHLKLHIKYWLVH